MNEQFKSIEYLNHFLIFFHLSLELALIPLIALSEAHPNENIIMLKIQMLEQIMNNENSDDDCEKSQFNSIDEGDIIQNGHVDVFVKKRSTKR